MNAGDLAAAAGLKVKGILPEGWPARQADSLAAWARRRGFFFFRVDSVHSVFSKDSTSVDAALWITEGECVRIVRMQVRGLDAGLSRKTAPLLEEGTGAAFNADVVENIIQRVLDVLEDNGHPLAKIEAPSIEWEESGLSVLLFADPGPLVRLQSVSVEGNTLTKSRVVLREARLKTGTPFSRKAVDEARNHLVRLGFFQEVGEPDVRFTGDMGRVTLKIRDGGANTIDAVAGYNPPQTERDKGYFTGRLVFGFSNLFGTGRLLDVYWEKKDEQSQAMRFGYEEPWLLGRPLHPGIRFRQEIRDTLYLEREWRFSLRFSPQTQLSAAIETGSREIVIDSLGSALTGLAQTRSWFLSARLDYSTLDDPVNPRQGVRYHTEYSTGRKKNLGLAQAQPDFKASVYTRSILADVEAVFSVIKRQVLYAGIHGAEIRSGDAFLPLSDQVRFGGSSTLRGYPEDAFRGSLAAWFNAEYRYLVGRHSRAFLFLDGGIYQRREKETGLVRGEKIGYGFGMRLETRLGIVGVDFGLGEGDTFMQGKVHVRLVNRF